MQVIKTTTIKPLDYPQPCLAEAKPKFEPESELNPEPLSTAMPVMREYSEQQDILDMVKTDVRQEYSYQLVSEPIGVALVRPATSNYNDLLFDAKAEAELDYQYKIVEEPISVALHGLYEPKDF